MELLEAHGRALAAFDLRVRKVADDQWNLPTPCPDWSVSALVDHLVYEQLWAVPLLRGATTEEVGDQFDGDRLGDDPKAAWRRTSLAAREAWLAVDLTADVHVSFGVIDAAEYGWQMTTDLAVHAWDLAKGIGADDTIDTDLAGELLERSRPIAAEFAGSSLFAPSVSVSDDADPETQLLALLGRDRSWSPRGAGR